MMKPNDKAYAVARNVAYNRINKCFVFDLIKEAVDAAFAAQFQSEDYAGLVKELREDVLQFNLKDTVYENIAKETADALEAVLAERDELDKWLRESKQNFMRVDIERNNLRAERDALLARLAPVDDDALVDIASKALHEKHGGPDDETYHAIVRCTLAAIRPHIVAAEKERCVKAVKKVAGRINVPLHERPEWEDGYLQGVHDAAAAIRIGK